MNYHTIQAYYNRLTTNADLPENVDVAGHLWYNILREYFLARDGFGLEVQPHPAPGVTKQSDNAHIRCVRKGNKTPLSLIENKLDSLERPDAVWQEAVRQLTEFMAFARMTWSSPDDHSEEEMVGIVTVGRFSRFYVLRSGEPQLDDHHATGDALLEFKEDETQIVNLLLSIRVRAPQSSSAGSQGATNMSPANAPASSASPPAILSNMRTKASVHNDEKPLRHG
ncbi:hypothetical protein C8A01DRAFT_20199 [Parachaetomium inaequale]|uniref:Uncharacterized protein n=1 Tax=Parachaetomium inaequale TaxID=2588326 RepID=A0AAN6SMJ2_9PEZI|nr:hypothetical protein C8A01DRAFT_20199 [Parachaetomium inaequale]